MQAERRRQIRVLQVVLLVLLVLLMFFDFVAPFPRVNSRDGVVGSYEAE